VKRLTGAGIALAAALMMLSPSPASAAGAQDLNCAPSTSSGFASFHLNTPWAQTFTAGRSGELLSVLTRGVARAAGGSGGPIDVKLYATSGGVPVHPAIASTQIPAASITANSAFHDYTAEFDPASAPFLTQGTQYAIGLSTPDSAQNSWRVWTDTCPGTIYGDFGGGFQLFSFTSGEDFSLATSLGPPNDDLARAEALDVVADVANGTTAGGTRETDEPDHLTIPPDAGAWVGDHSVWYGWRALGSGTTTVDVCTGAIDSIVAVYSLGGSGSSFADLTRVTDNNNGADEGNCPVGTFGSFATFEAVAGTTYRFAVGDAGGARESTFTIGVTGQADQPPVITPVQPAPGSKTRRAKPRIKATVTDATQLDDANMTISVDGQSRIVTYNPNSDVVSAKSQKLSRGRHTVTVTASDGILGGEASWNFRVKKKRR
jgi:hypothetical protein